MKNQFNIHRLIPLFAVLIITVGQMSIDIYVPSLPDLSREWQTSSFIMQLTLTVFALGYSVSQLFYGPLSDRLGRRKILLSGFGVYLLGTFICMIAFGPYMLILGRFIQGVGIGSSQVVGRAITRDQYSGTQLIKVMAYISMAIALSPAIAPTLGGFIHDTLGWRGSFAVLFVWVSILWCIFFKVLPETLKQPLKKAPFIKSTLQNYKYILSFPVFITNGMLVILTFTGFMAFQMIAPFIFQHTLNYSATGYGSLIIFVAAGYMMGTFTNNRIIEHIGLDKTMRLGAFFLLLGGATMLACGMLGILNVFVILIPMALFSFGSGLVNPVAMASMLSPFPSMAGTAGAAMGSTLMLAATIWSLVAALLPETSQIPLASILLCNSLIFIFLLRVRLKYSPNLIAEPLSSQS